MPSPSSDEALAAKPTPSISASDAVLHIHSARLIEASPDATWNTLIDTSTWPSWNSFVPRVTIREQPGESHSLSEQEPLSPILQLGTKMTFHVHMDLSPTSSAQDVPLAVVAFDPPSQTQKLGRIVWANDVTAKGGIPASLLSAERVHEVEEVEVPGSDKKVTEVRNWEAQVGWLVYVVRWMYGDVLKRDFEAWVGDLKAFVEAGSST